MNADLHRPSLLVRPAGDICCIGIIGEGKMGSNIFNYLLDFDFTLVWICSQDADPEGLQKGFLKKISRKLATGIITKEQFHTKKTGITITKNLNAAAACDLIIEAIPEIPEKKQAIFQRLDVITRTDCLFTSNSSSINPGGMIPSEARKQTFAGLHFFYPVGLKNIVEITFPETASDETRMKLYKFCDNIQRKFLVLNEKNSFILNRIFLDFQNEAYQLVKNGHISMKNLDELVRNNFFPFGVFDFMDSVGLDTMLSAIKNYIADYPHQDYFSSLINELNEKISQGYLGQKSGQGFYPLPQDEKTDSFTDQENIVYHLRQTFYSSAKRFTLQSHASLDEMNHAIREYFGLEKGPFEI